MQIKLSAIEHHIAGKPGGNKSGKGIYDGRQSEQKKFKDSATNLMNQQITISRLFTFLMPLVFLVANLGQATTLYAGGQQIIHGTLIIR